MNRVDKYIESGDRVVALYGTLMRGERNVAFIDWLVEKKFVWRDRRTRRVRLENTCLSILPGDLPALYHNVEGVTEGVMAELLAVSPEGFKALCHFEGSPEWYNPMTVLAWDGNECNGVTAFFGPRGEGVEIQVQVPDIIIRDPMVVIPPYDYAQRDKEECPQRAAMLHGVLAQCN